MAADVIPPPPPGFVREDVPPPPPGFVIEATQNTAPPAPPPGFVLETQAPPTAPADPAPPPVPATHLAQPMVQPATAGPVLLSDPRLPAPAPALVSQETEFLGGILPEFAKRMAPPTSAIERVMNPQPLSRLPHAIAADFARGRRDITPAEFGSVVQAMERGTLENPDVVRQQLALSLSPAGRQMLDDAMITASTLATIRGNKGALLSPGARTFGEGLLSGATMNMADPIPPSAAPVKRAHEIDREQRAGESPWTRLGGEAAGSVIPYSAGVKLLRGLRAARGAAPLAGDTAAYQRGLADIEGAALRPGSKMTLAERTAAERALDSRLATTGDIVAEGAKVGGAQAFATRPEGADDMGAGEELAARTAQAGLGIAAGAAFDWAAIKGGEKIGKALAPLFKRLEDSRFERALGEEARAKGFDDVDSYVASLIDIVDTADGAIVRPRAEVAQQLPGETKALQSSNNAIPAAEPVRPDFASEADLRKRAYEEKARGLGLNDAQREAFAPAERGDPLTGFQGRRDREPTIKRAIDFARQTNQPAQYVALDIGNLGGLNARFGEPGADKVFRELAAIAREELDGLPGRTHLFRHGGDEMSAVVAGVDDAALSAALTRIGERSRAYVRANGLETIPHTKADKAPGTGLHYGSAPIRGDSTLADVLELAHRRLENAKENYVDPGLSETARPRGLAEQADGAQGVYSPARGGSGGEGAGTRRAQPADRTAQRLAEYERLAASTADPEIRADLRRRADVLRGELRGEPVKTTPKERAERSRQIDATRDDLITAIRKLGGIDTAIETDYAGRLSHVPRRGFGLPAIERPGKGRTLDDLAEALHERGYLMGRDVRELSEKLDRASAGEDMRSLSAEFDGPDAPPRPRSSDRDWTYQDSDAPIEGDFVIDTDAGTVVPAKAFTEDDWARLAQEESDARQWYEREGDGSGGVPARLSDPVQGRAGDKPEPGKTGELPGLERRDDGRQAVADAQRVKDAARNGDGYVAPSAGPGDLFAGPRPKQSTLYANPFAQATADIARDIGLHPGRNVAAGFAGGVVGATNSEAEVGSAQWWLDVAAGAAGGLTMGQLLRRTNLLGKGAIVDNLRARLGDWIEGLPLIGRGPVELQALKTKQRVMRELLERQTEAVGRELLKRFTPSERAMMSDLIERRGIVAEFNLVHRQAQELDDYITATAERMKALDMLPADMETGGYLHRYYAKHLGLDGAFREAKRQTLAGSYSIARGTESAFALDYLSPGARTVVDEWTKVGRELDALERKRPDLLDSDTAARVTELRDRKRALEATEFREFVGSQNGRVQSFIFAGDEAGRLPRDAGTGPAIGGRTISTDAGGRAAPAAEAVDRPAFGGAALDARAVPEVPGVAGLAPTDRRWTLRGANKREAVLHRDWTKAERQAWGEIEDAGYRYVRGMAEVAHDLSLATLFDAVARRADWTSATARTLNGKEWVRVPEGRVNARSPLRQYGALAGKYVRPDVWAGIQNHGRAPFAQGRIGQTYRDLLSKWKLYKTVYNPVTHLNNTYSNLEMLYMSDYRARDLARAIRIAAAGEGDAVWREARDAGLFGTDWTTSLLVRSEGGGSMVLDDLARQLREQPEIPDMPASLSAMMQLKEWWAGTRAAVDKADGAWRTGLEIAKAMSQPVAAGGSLVTRPVKAAGRAMQRAYKFEDDVFKLAVYSAERKKGAKPEAAARQAHDLFFDYQDVPLGIKWARDFPIGSPFITYTYKAIPAIARNVVQHPERWLALVAAYEAFNYAALTASDEMGPGEYWQVESAENATSAPWDRGRSFWGARNTVRLPYPESYRIALGRMHAGGNPFASEAGGRKKIENAPTTAWGSSVFGSNPLHALLDTLVFNEDWKGKEIYKSGAPLEDKARAVAAYLYQAWGPSNPLFPASHAQTKILDGMANDARAEPDGIAAPVVKAANDVAEALGFQQLTGVDRAGAEINTRDALLASVGVKLRPIQTETTVEFEAGRYQEEKEAVAKWFAERSRLYADGRITDAQLAEAEAEFDRRLDAIDAKQDELFSAESFLRKRASGAAAR